MPAGSVQTAGTDPSTVTVTGGATVDAGADGFQQRGSVTGVVFNDINGNGTRDAGEPGLAAVSVAVGPQTVVTDTAGVYTATGVPAGSVGVDIVAATLPPGVVQTAGTDPETVTVTGGATADAGADGYQAPPSTGSVTGVVFADLNGNGSRDAGESGIAGVSVQVGAQSVVTDANGVYTATAVPVGSVTVDVVEATLLAGSVQTAGTDPTTVTVSVGATADAGSDGYQIQGTVTGVVFSDLNGNGTRDGGEPGLAGVSVQVGARTVVTNASGSYTATAIPAGSVTVDVVDGTLPAGVVQTAGTDPNTLVVSGGVTVSAGADGYQPPVATGSVTGVVFNDLNGNGSRDTGEPGLAGVSVDVGAQTVVTDGLGVYLATGVQVGSVTVDVNEASLPAGSVQTAGVDPTTVTVAADATADAGADGFQQRGSIAGLVFSDTNGNGAQDVGELGIGGVTVLVGVLNVTTDANGNYGATNLAPGSITIDVVEASLPAGAVQTAGTDPSSVTVTAGVTADAGADGYQQRGTVSGVVFDDVNGNGSRDAGEPGLAGVDVLVGAQTVTTNAAGVYTAVGVPVGTVTVDVVQASLPAGMTQTAGVDPSTVTVTGGATVDAGIDGYRLATTTGTVSGVVFNDLDGNGTRDAGEPGLAGVDVQVNGAVVTTDGTGVYTATGVPAGTATVAVVNATLPSGWTQTAGTDPSTVTVTAGATADAGVDGYQAPAGTGSVTGVIFADLNGNGARDASEPGLANVAVQVGGQTATTDVNGVYTVNGIAPGAVTVDVVEASLPAGSVQTAGLDPSTVTVIVDTTADAGADGYQAQGSVTGTVFDDLNGNGARDAGEPGLADVDVLVGGQTVTTDANGVYTATTVAAGTVIVDVVDATLPAGVTQTAGTDPTTVTVNGGASADAGIDGYRAPTATGTVTGVVFDDANGNGVQDPGEPGLPAVSVVVNGVTVITDGTGSYTASGVPVGPVVVDVVDATVPAGRVVTTGNDPTTVMVTAGGTATVATGYRPGNRPPIADDEVETTPQGTPVTISVLVGDSDPDGDTLSVIAVTSPANGAAAINADGTVTYTPNPGFVGTDTFTYTVSDGRGGSTTATVTVTVTAIDHLPVAVPDTNRVTQGDACVGGTPTCVAGTVLGNDRGLEDGPLQLRVVTPPVHGTIVLNQDGSYIYSPDPTFVGTDVFTYEVCDRDGQCSQATVTIVVDAAPVPPTTDLQIVITTDSVPTPGGSGTYTVTVSNRSIVSETGPVVVTIVLPPGTTFDGVVGVEPDWTCTAAGQTVTCTTPQPIIGGAVTDVRIRVVYPPDVSGPIQIDARVTGVVRDTVPVNNAARIVVSGSTAGRGTTGGTSEPQTTGSDLTRTGQNLGLLVTLAMLSLLLGLAFVVASGRRSLPRNRRRA